MYIKPYMYVTIVMHAHCKLQHTCTLPYVAPNFRQIFGVFLFDKIFVPRG